MKRSSVFLSMPMMVLLSCGSSSAAQQKENGVLSRLEFATKGSFLDNLVCTNSGYPQNALFP